MSEIPERKRCAWASSSQQYIDYHDKKWGIPVHGLPSRPTGDYCCVGGCCGSLRDQCRADEGRFAKLVTESRANILVTKERNNVAYLSHHFLGATLPHYWRANCVCWAGTAGSCNLGGGWTGHDWDWQYRIGGISGAAGGYRSWQRS